MLNVSYTGDNADLIKNIVDSITRNYLEQNISRQAAQDAKSLNFSSQQLPKVPERADFAEDKLNLYRQQNDS